MQTVIQQKFHKFLLQIFSASTTAIISAMVTICQLVLMPRKTASTLFASQSFVQIQKTTLDCSHWQSKEKNII
jgi:hypothetical protein